MQKKRKEGKEKDSARSLPGKPDMLFSLLDTRYSIRIQLPFFFSINPISSSCYREREREVSSPEGGLCKASD